MQKLFYSHVLNLTTPPKGNLHEAVVDDTEVTSVLELLANKLFYGALISFTDHWQAII